MNTTMNENTRILIAGLMSLSLTALSGTASAQRVSLKSPTTQFNAGQLGRVSRLSVLNPMASLKTPSLTPLSGLVSPLSAPTLALPLAVTPLASIAPAPEALSPAARIEGALSGARSILTDMPDIKNADMGSLHGLGMRLNDALTGETSHRGDGSGNRTGKEESQLAFEAQVADAAKIIKNLRDEIGKVIVGQTEMIDAIILSFISGDHDLLEGVPGVAKTKAVVAFAKATNAQFSRIQGTPDKLPSDILGAEILQEDPATGEKSFHLKKGPIFANIVLVDEINRMLPKTQAALLEAMQERQVTIGDQTIALPYPFMLLATQNPIEQEGTYRLPEAQQDRFMLKVIVDRPKKSELREIMNRHAVKDTPEAEPVVSLEEFTKIGDLAENIIVADSLQDYITDLVEATHNPGAYGLAGLKDTIEEGASPRAAIYLIKAAKIRALMNGRTYVTDLDIKHVAVQILRHRLKLSFKARKVTTDMVVMQILDSVPVPKGARLAK